METTDLTVVVRGGPHARTLPTATTLGQLGEELAAQTGTNLETMKLLWVRILLVLLRQI